MIFYALKTCDTCRKAIKAAGAAGKPISVVDVRADGVARADMERFFTAFGTDLVNKSSATWRGLDESERADDPIDLLLRHPTLMKRPVIDVDGQLFLGWKPEVQAAVLG